MTRDDHPWKTGGRTQPPQCATNVGAPRGSSKEAEVPTVRLREAFEKSGLSKSELAARLGWVRPNIDKLNRALGYRPDSNSSGGVRTEPRALMSYELAVKLCEAMNADYFEAGI